MQLIDFIPISLTITGFFFSLLIIYIMWIHKKEMGSRFFLYLLITISIWSLGYVFEMSLPTENLKILSAKVEYIGVAFLPVYWFAFCSVYSNRFKEVVRTKVFYSLLIVPIITVLMVFTNEIHGMIWQKIIFYQLGDIKILLPQYGAWFWVHALYSYLLFIIGSIIIISASLRFPRVHRRRSLIVILGAIIPWISNILYISRFSPFDPTPVSFVISSILFFLAVYKYKLIDIIPVARDEIIENMDDAVIVLDSKNRIVDLNRAAENLLSTSRRIAIGSKAVEVLLDCPHALDMVMKDEGRKTCKRSGKYFDIKVMSIRDENNESAGKIVVIRDVTEAKLYQKKLEMLNRNLEKEVRRRTSEIQDLLKQKDEFISQLGHDLKTPLTPLLSLLPLVKERIKDEDTRRLVDISLRNARYMKNLVVDTLNLAKLNLPNVDFNIEDVKLSEIIEESIKDNEHIMKKKNIVPMSKVNEDIVVKADKLRLKEVLTNLISNSVKYTPPGGRIEFVAHPNGDEVIVQVRDTGMGLREDQKERIFDEFYKVDESRHNIESSGLGLTICKRIVEKHGGRIWADSEGIGKGTVISFTLPPGDGRYGKEKNIGG